MEQSRQWSIRIMHEAFTAPSSCFVTLTYANEHLPPNGVLWKPHYPEFIKRLRINARRKLGVERIRYFQVGEFGGEKQRPHHHAALFGCDFRQGGYDCEPARSGHPQWGHELLDKAWQHKGRVRVMALTPESAAYLARYVTQKRIGEALVTVPEHIDTDTGEYIQQGEYASMSTKPGIGHDWFKQYGDPIWRSDRTPFQGSEQKPPDYYLRLIRKEDLIHHGRMKSKRIAKAEAQGEPDLNARRENFLARAKHRRKRS